MTYEFLRGVIDVLDFQRDLWKTLAFRCLNNEDTTLNKGSILVLGWVPLLTCGTQPNRGYQNRPPKQSDLPTAAISCAPCRISCIQDRVRCGGLQSFDRLDPTVCSFPTPVLRSLFIAKPVLDMIVNF
ncbi:hypothetical protein AVEN_158998-1 [Araneus ventricosus]|uniref:Uncharacterized protein n=1 Tax=Araneus ventricosus TaxID=182803 RepID=A0A4Y2BBR9_ARAVE|nr:hypothetical protein AVEN_158998-1 [Araneus ventricosus]